MKLLMAAIFALTCMTYTQVVFCTSQILKEGDKGGNGGDAILCYKNIETKNRVYKSIFAHSQL